MLRLIIFSFGTNEDQYSDNVYGLFCYLREIGALVEGRDFRVEFRKLFAVAFLFFNNVQKAVVFDALKNLVNKEEIFSFKVDGKPRLIQYWGRGKYAFLLKLPAETIMADPVMKRQFQELKRKFGPYVDKTSNGPVVAGIVGKPLTPDAYSRMSVKQWLNSFRRYSRDRDTSNGEYLKGGIEEHSSGFREAAGKENAEKMFEIVETALEHGDIDIVYPLKGLWGLVDSGADHPRAVAITKKLLAQREIAENVWYILYIIKSLVRGVHVEAELVRFLVS